MGQNNLIGGINYGHEIIKETGSRLHGLFEV